ncbi:hypothetical protein HK405_005618 [Cladochytrium tenue]|nr:hypothetical protein HK405_005618 [Cladochytrium tenue]
MAAINQSTFASLGHPRSFSTSSHASDTAFTRPPAPPPPPPPQLHPADSSTDFQRIVFPRPRRTAGASIAYRVNATCTAVGDRVYAFGGLVIFGGRDANDEYLNDLYILNLSTMEWQRPETSGTPPSGRSKHSAVIYDGSLYIYGGWEAMDLVSSQLNVLNLRTMQWNTEPIHVVPRHSHFCTAYKHRLYIYGGMTPSMDPATDILILDLVDYVQTSVALMGGRTPPTLGQHFSQLCGDRLVVLVTRSLGVSGGMANANGIGREAGDGNPLLPGAGAMEAISSVTGVPDLQAEEMMQGQHDISSDQIPVGIWSLSLDGLRWRYHDSGRYLGSAASWHYYAMGKDQSRMLLFGDGKGLPIDQSAVEQSSWQRNRGRNSLVGERHGSITDDGDGDGAIGSARSSVMPDAAADEHFGVVLEIDLEVHGLFKIPEDAMSLNFEPLLTFSSDDECGEEYDDDEDDAANALAQVAPQSRPTLRRGSLQSPSRSASAVEMALASADMTLLCRDPSAPATRVHRLVLLTRWPHFAAIERSGMSEAGGGQVVRELRLDEPLATVRGLVRFLYTDSVARVRSDRVVADLLVLADLYCMDRLRRLCSARLHASLSVRTAVRTYVAAHRAADRGLRARALRFCLERFGAVTRTAGFRWLLRAAASTSATDSAAAADPAGLASALQDLWNCVPPDASLVSGPLASTAAAGSPAGSGVGGGGEGGPASAAAAFGGAGVPLLAADRHLQRHQAGRRRRGAGRRGGGGVAAALRHDDGADNDEEEDLAGGDDEDAADDGDGDGAGDGDDGDEDNDDGTME